MCNTHNDPQMAPQLCRIQRINLPLRMCDIFGRSNTKKKKKKKLGASFCYSGSLINSTDILQIQSKHLLSWMANGCLRKSDPSRLSPCRGARQTIRFKTGTTREENHHYHHHCHAFCKKDNKHRQRYNHALTDPRKRKERLAREESALRAFDTLGLSIEQTF